MPIDEGLFWFDFISDTSPLNPTIVALRGHKQAITILNISFKLPFFVNLVSLFGAWLRF